MWFYGEKIFIFFKYQLIEFSRSKCFLYAMQHFKQIHSCFSGIILTINIEYAYVFIYQNISVVLENDREKWHFKIVLPIVKMWKVLSKAFCFLIMITQNSLDFFFSHLNVITCGLSKQNRVCLDISYNWCYYLVCPFSHTELHGHFNFSWYT